MGKSLYCQDKSGVTQDLELPLAGLGSSAYPVCDKSPLPLIRQGRKVYPVGQKGLYQFVRFPKTVPDSTIFHFRYSTLQGKKEELLSLFIINMSSHQVQPSTVEQQATVEARQEAQELQGQVDAATQRAIDSRADNQPPTTKKAYSRPQALWKASPLAPEPLGRSQILYLSYHLP